MLHILLKEMTAHTRGKYDHEDDQTDQNGARVRLDGPPPSETAGPDYKTHYVGYKTIGKLAGSQWVVAIATRLTLDRRGKGGNPVRFAPPLKFLELLVVRCVTKACLLWVISGHLRRKRSCLLFGS